MTWFENISSKILQKRSKTSKKTQENTKSDTTPHVKQKTDKEVATEKGEPYVAIVSMNINPDNLHEGAFELDWNDKFIASLVKAGYMMKKEDTDAEIVDRWFQNICRHIVMETWEQEEAMNPQRRNKVRDIGNGRTEIS